jgi:hypothetical protein
MELPINKLITIIIFLVVLLSIAYLLFSVGNSNQASLESDIRNCCPAYRSNDCKLYLSDITCPNGESLSNLAPRAGYDEGLLNKTCMC